MSGPQLPGGARYSRKTLRARPRPWATMLEVVAWALVVTGMILWLRYGPSFDEVVGFALGRG